MTQYVISNLDRPNRYWNAGKNEQGCDWSSEMDGSYKSYTSKARAERAAIRVIKRGYRVDVIVDPARR